MDRVGPGDRGEQHADPDRDRGGQHDETHDRLPATGDGESKTETDHGATASAGVVTRPSRTMTSRSAYAATRASWVTSTTVVP